MPLRWLATSLMLMTAAVAQAQPLQPSLAPLFSQALALAARTMPAPNPNGRIVVDSNSDAPALRDITVRVDDNVLMRYEFSDPEARALQQGAQYRFEMPAVGAGTHRLRIDFQQRIEFAHVRSETEHQTLLHGHVLT